MLSPTTASMENSQPVRSTRQVEAESPDGLKIFAIIPARGGSKGIPRKALRMLGGIPLIAYTISDALAIQGVSKVFVSTDDPEIQAVSIAYGAEVPFLRPPHLAQDDSNLVDALNFSYDWYREHEGFVDDVSIIMSPTHPFRRPDLIDNALRLGLDNPEVFNVGSISLADVMPSNYWVKVDGGIRRFECPANIDQYPEIFYQSAFSFNIVFNCRLHLPNRRIPFILNEIESIDVDEPRDLQICQMVIEEGLYPFERVGYG